MFSEDRAIGMVSLFLEKSASRRLNDLVLMKILYISERRSLEQTNTLISDSSFASLPKGPVTSEVLNLMKGNRRSEKWEHHFKFLRKGQGVDENTVELCEPFDYREELSIFEMKLLNSVWDEFGSQEKWDLVELTHDFPEWEKKALENERAGLYQRSFDLALSDILLKGLKQDPSVVSH